MNYQSLKWMIESIINSYKCPECKNMINENNIEIIWAAWNTVNIDIWCLNCWKHSMIKTEVLSIDLTNKWLSQESINKLRQNLLNLKPNTWFKKSKIINDEEIVNLNKNMKKQSFQVSDLFWEKK